MLRKSFVLWFHRQAGGGYILGIDLGKYVLASCTRAQLVGGALLGIMQKGIIWIIQVSPGSGAVH